MAETTAFVFIFGLVGALASNDKQVVSPLDTDSSLPLKTQLYPEAHMETRSLAVTNDDLPAKDTLDDNSQSKKGTEDDEDLITKMSVGDIPLEPGVSPFLGNNQSYVTKHSPQTPPSAEEGKDDTLCEEFCKVCNLTGKIVNGSCSCFNENGLEVMCARNIGSKRLDHGGRDSTGELKVELSGVEDTDVMRGERCLLTMAKPPVDLQTMLGKGLKGMSTEERLAEFRKRVDSLRRKPKSKTDESEDCNCSGNADGGSSPVFPLPVPPTMNKNIGGKSQKVGTGLINIEGGNIETDFEPSLIVGGPLGIKGKPEKPAGNVDKEQVSLVDSLRRKPKLKTDESEDCNCSGNADGGSSPVFPLPVPPNMNKNIGGKSQKVGTGLINIEGGNIETDFEPSLIVGGPLGIKGKPDNPSGYADKEQVSLGRSASLFPSPVSPFKNRDSGGKAQAGSKGLINIEGGNVETVVRPSVVIKPPSLPSLRKPKIETDKSEECDDRNSSPIFPLPVSPFMNQNLGEKRQNNGKGLINIEGGNVETVVRPSAVIKPPYLPSLRKSKIETDKSEERDDRNSRPIFPLPVSPFMNQNLGEERQNNAKGLINIEGGDVKTIVNPSIAVGAPRSRDNSFLLRCRALGLPPSPVRRSVDGSSHGAGEPLGYSAIKLPSQFLALTKLRERMVDIDKIPDYDGAEPVSTGEKIFTSLKPQNSILSMKNVNAERLAPPKMDNSQKPAFPGTPVLASSPDLASSSIEEIPVLPDGKEIEDRVSQSDQEGSHGRKEPILEGIIAIPKYLMVK